MPRTYGTTNVMPYATAPPVGAVGDEYYNTTTKQLFLSDGTAWNPVQGGGGGGGAPYAPVQTTPPPASSPTVSPPVGLLWVDTGTTSSGTNLIFYQTLAAPLASAPATVTHNLGTIYIQAQLWDVVTGLLVGAQIKIIDANNIQISVTQNMPNNVNVVVLGQPGPGLPVNPPDYATKLYVDQRTPNLPPPVTSGTTVQSYTDVLGDVWVALNGVNAGAWKRARDVMHARAHRVAAYGITSTLASIPLDTASRDPYGFLSGGALVAPISGLYHFDGHIDWASGTAVSFVNFYIMRNGQAVASGIFPGNANQWGAAAMNDQFPAVAGDAFTIGGYGPVSVTLTVRTGLAETFLTMNYLGTG
jgi:hypothetical protein